MPKIKTATAKTTVERLRKQSARRIKAIRGGDKLSSQGNTESLLRQVY